MQDGIPVMFVPIMGMPHPVAGPDMDLHRARIAPPADNDPGFPAIGPLIPVKLTGRQDLQGFPRFSKKFLLIKIAMPPNEVQ